MHKMKFFKNTGNLMQNSSSKFFCGVPVSSSQLKEITEIVETFNALSRAEIANTICEIFDWKRPTGKLKTVECRQFLEQLNSEEIINLPALRKQRKKTKQTILKTKRTEALPVITANIDQLLPVTLTQVTTGPQRKLWYEYIDRYHYLGYQQPFGAQLRYFIHSGKNKNILGCLQFSNSAWKMAPRDRWIRWSEEARKANLQKIINNSRFLILPWVQVKNLASHVLAKAVKQLPDDWEACYGYRPVLMETLVDQSKFKGTCYKAANWVHLGSTTGRGRMDSDASRVGLAPKKIYVYPLSSNFREKLLEQQVSN